MTSPSSSGDFSSNGAEVHLLRAENAALRAELAALRSANGSSGRDMAELLEVATTTSQQHQQHQRQHQQQRRTTNAKNTWVSPGAGDALSSADLERYARHLSLPSFGASKQAALARARVLLVGVGGLGSPAALYLAASGVGHLSLADADVVEVSNLHRQIIHTEARTGTPKAVSGAASCGALNGGCRVTTHLDGVNQRNALALMDAHDVVLDCTDNVETRYLLSDACAVAGVPLVSAAAVGLEGQLTVYHRDRCAAAAGAACGGGAQPTSSGAAAGAGGARGGGVPCYRCVFPRAPAAKDCTSCARGGVLGPVPGVMGVLQAVECVKVITGLGDTLAGRLLMYDATSSSRPFAVVRLRGRDAGCAACGDHPRITRDTLASYDYLGFTSGDDACVIGAGAGVGAGAGSGSGSKPPSKTATIKPPSSKPTPLPPPPPSSSEVAGTAAEAAGAKAATGVAFGDTGGYELDDAAAAAARNASLHRGDGAPPWGIEHTSSSASKTTMSATAAGAGPGGAFAAADPALHGAPPWAMHDESFIAPSASKKAAPAGAGAGAGAGANRKQQKQPSTTTTAVTLDVSAPVPRHAREPGPGRVTPADLQHALHHSIGGGDGVGGGGGGGGGFGGGGISSPPNVVVLDVRPRHLYAAAALRGSVSVPLSELEARLPEVMALGGGAGAGEGGGAAAAASLYCVCSRGNDSQRAERFLRTAGVTTLVGDVIGGLERWREDIDPTFPKLV